MSYYPIRKVLLLRTDLQTPNFAMDVEDVPYLGNGPVPQECLTMQSIGAPLTFRRTPIPENDVEHHGCMQGIPPLSPLLLDFMYGAIIYRHWAGSTEFKTLVNEYSAAHFTPALALPPHTATVFMYLRIWQFEP
jgi:hypothetical protein